MKRKLTEIAHALDLPPDTVHRWIRQGRIPIQKKGDKGIFKDTVLRQWALKHQLRYSLDRGQADSQVDTGLGTLLSAMQAGRVFHGIKGDTSVSVLESAVRVVPGLSAQTRQILLKRLVERESLTSTGIGKGVAIPHPRSPVTDKDKKEKAVITTCFLDHPVDFDAVDDKPVFVLFLLMSPSVKIHLHLLSRLAFCVRDDSFVGFLATLPGPNDLFLKITDFESRLED